MNKPQAIYRLVGKLSARHWLLFGLVVLMLIPGIGISSLDPEVFKAAWNAGHFFWPILVMPPFVRSLADRLPSLNRRLLLCAAGVFLIACSIELAQQFLQRSATVEDVALTMYGALAASILLWLAASRGRLQPVLLILAFVVVVVLGLRPLLIQTYVFARSFNLFPVIDDFDSWSTLTRWSGSNLRLTDLLEVETAASEERPHWADDPGWLQIPLKSSPQGKGWRNAITHTIPGNWSAYSTLTVRLYMSAPAQIGVRLDDLWYIDHGESRYTNRMNTSFDLDTGYHELVLPESTWTRTPSKRVLDKSAIKRVILFARAVTSDIVVSVGEIRLD